MLQNQKVLITILVLVVIGIAGYLGYVWYDGKNMGGSAVFMEEPATLPSGSETNDESLKQDTAAIDAQLKGLDADSASADASLKESAEIQ